MLGGSQLRDQAPLATNPLLDTPIIAVENGPGLDDGESLAPASDLNVDRLLTDCMDSFLFYSICCELSILLVLLHSIRNRSVKKLTDG